MKALFELPVTTGEGVDFNGYLPLTYDTGLTLTVNLPNENGDVVPTEVPLYRGGHSIVDNVEPNLVDAPKHVVVECSAEKMAILKADANYHWIKDLPED